MGGRPVESGAVLRLVGIGVGAGLEIVIRAQRSNHLHLS